MLGDRRIEVYTLGVANDISLCTHPAFCLLHTESVSRDKGERSVKLHPAESYDRMELGLQSPIRLHDASLPLLLLLLLLLDCKPQILHSNNTP
jgi:hypothetical protein